ncbi:hypothetical protein BU16DRAFT_470287 [Lophium mytilinum]|uniref:ubiquitinyl hydrolase 1 n=1 Tax=Lophium mytilinum TaxID=390894 RepID=A0A6A6QDY3_9PEZI|nr:hypothetical protein BU16DRAFT_470287 [Lophium mytilinum]
MTGDKDALAYIIAHTFLPPRVPQGDDESTSMSEALYNKFLEGMIRYQALLGEEEGALWDLCIQMVKSVCTELDTNRLLVKIESLASLALHISAQNAALFIRKSESSTAFGSFELSPSTRMVMSCKGRLRRSIPGPAIDIPNTVLADMTFRDPVVETLVKFSSDTPYVVKPSTKKAGSTVNEIRETIDPILVTGMLTGALRAVGTPADVVRIQKNTRDDVLWDNKLRPWRRSPFWLLLRAAVHTTLAQIDTDLARATHRYKLFMIFFLGTILDSAIDASPPLPSELLFVMSAKISRRILKLDIRFSLLGTEKTLLITQELLRSRWNKLETEKDPAGIWGTWNDASFRISAWEDVALKLPKFRSYLDSLANRPLCSSTAVDFKPERLYRIKESSEALSFRMIDPISLPTSHAKHIILADIERWVANCLPSWLTNNIHLPTTVVHLAAVLKTYSTAAVPAYSDHPVLLSRMYLTVMEIWIGMDKAVIEAHPVVGQVSVGFPPAFLEPLLLPSKEDMDRLLSIEQYLTERNRFDPSGRQTNYLSSEANGLAYKFYDSSTALRELREKIMLDAEKERAKKCDQMQIAKESHSRRLAEINEREHFHQSRINKRGTTVSEHIETQCQTCVALNRLNAMTIDVYEMPIPLDEVQARLVMFELGMPEEVRQWRTATYRLQFEIIASQAQQSGRTKAKEKIYFLRDYWPLNRYRHNESRCSLEEGLQLGSETKSFVVAHYRKPTVSASLSENDVIVNHGMKYNMYDSRTSRPAEGLLSLCDFDIRSRCTFRIPKGSYSKLDFAISDTKQTSNQITALQSDCPTTMHLDEFTAFGNLRAGHRVQWLSIAKELAARELSFGRYEVCALFVQACWQAGPSEPSSSLREAHLILELEHVGLTLLTTMEDNLSLITKNWEGTMAARIFTVIAARLLSLCTHQDLRTKARSFLRRARDISLAWTRELQEKVHKTIDDVERSRLRVKLLEAALVCHTSFGVDFLSSSDSISPQDDVSDALECLITIQQNYPRDKRSIPFSIRDLLMESFHLCHRYENKMRHRILEDSSGIDAAIGRIWKDYQPCGEWTMVAAPNGHWVTTSTKPSITREPRSIHLSLLTGELLVDGKPISRLPPEFEKHPTFKRLFGKRILDVVSSDMNGMDYRVRNHIEGYGIHLAMCDTELIIHAIAEDGHEIQLIPSSKLEGNLPNALVQDHVHWRHLDNEVVEWRLAKSPWIAEVVPWKLIQNSDSTTCTYRLHQGNKILVENDSSIGHVLAALLAPLEQTDNIQITLDELARTVEVHLPRLNLDFALSADMSTLESKQFRGYMIDDDQTVGTMTGLKNKLVLSNLDSSKRCIIIPYGKVSCVKNSNHVDVTIDAGGTSHVSYYVYHVDLVLGRLTGNDTLTGSLFKAYLHAMTSHCLPDRLTGRTGTEEALNYLQGAAIRSYTTFTDDDADLLSLLARLTPQRVFYPKNSKLMQQTEWSDLPAHSQHNRFGTEVRAVIEHYNKLNFLSNQLIPKMDLPQLDQHLLERTSIRDASYRGDGYGAELYTTQHDSVYVTRDDQEWGKVELRSYEAARLVCSWSVDLKCDFRIWNFLRDGGKAPIPGVIAQNKPYFELVQNLSYDPAWLDAGDDFLAHVWWSLQSRLSTAVEAYLRNPANSPEAYLRKLRHESNVEFENRCRRKYEEEVDRSEQLFVDVLMRHWLVPFDGFPRLFEFESITQYMDTAAAVQIAERDFWDISDNFQARDYIDYLQAILNSLNIEVGPSRPYSLPLSPASKSETTRYIGYYDLFQTSPPTISPPVQSPDFSQWMRAAAEDTMKHGKLDELLLRLRSKHKDSFPAEYMQELQRSLDALNSSSPITDLDDLREGIANVIREYLRVSLHRLESIEDEILNAMKDGTKELSEFDLFTMLAPRLSRMSLLEHLSIKKRNVVSPDWKNVLIQYGEAISAVQRAHRLHQAVRNPHANSTELSRELTNASHPNSTWDTHKYPDWLLLELENDILIRDEQVNIGLSMIHPKDNKNSIYQLNMGRGKSTVIVPMVAAAVGDGFKMTRVVVLKSLAPEMQATLIAKCSGLLGRTIYSMPFARSLKLLPSLVRRIREICQECMRTGGILLALPEHLLSFELMGYESILNKKAALGKELWITKRWLRDNARDILDECDELLSVASEQIYTMGTQSQIAYGAQRWTMVQYLLAIVARKAKEVFNSFPDGIEFEDKNGPGSFPQIRILQPQAGDLLLKSVAREVSSNGCPIAHFRVRDLSAVSRDKIYRAVTEMDSSELEDLRLLRDQGKIDQPTWNSILILRGLIAFGIFKFAFEEKRWRVHYGLDRTRSGLAVPYRAKDVPSARAEYSHPDSTIVLTHLSYYYEGLPDKEMRSTFSSLYRSNNAQEEYESWVRDADGIPVEYRHIEGVNLQDTVRCSVDIFPHLRFVKRVIDFYLSSLVLPVELREFKQKLSASGWNIAEDRAHPTTGFSGTNDTSYLLPLSIAQSDVMDQLHTNAAVLSDILGLENSYKKIMGTSTSRPVSAEMLLQMVTGLDPPVRVILDVGAQVLDLRNEGVAQRWLDIVPVNEAEAVVFFTETDVLYVLDRKGKLERLAVSPFLRQMDRCLVYFDQAHTRGADLKLPKHYRAAVNLGPLLTKDRIAQACMRMRELGKGQSVVMCASEEVEKRIRDTCRIDAAGHVNVSHVLEWCIDNTCTQIRKEIPLWAKQGQRYLDQQSTLLRMDTDIKDSLPLNVAEELLEAEAQDLETRYGAKPQSLLPDFVFSSGEGGSRSRSTKLNDIIARCYRFNINSSSGTTLGDEQEREQELCPENQREQEVNRPRPMQPLKHTVHRSIKHFVETGILLEDAGTQPAFTSLTSTSAAKHSGLDEWPQDLRVTMDFAKTVKALPGHLLDKYLKPVNWILSAHHDAGSQYLIISQEEANELLPSILGGGKVTLHVYTPRVRHSMRSFDDLSFCEIPQAATSTVPPQIATSIGCFAGRTYFPDYEEYQSTCDMLGLSYDTPGAHNDGFVPPKDRSTVRLALSQYTIRHCPFTVSQINLLREVTAIRRKDQSVERSHMGAVFRGEVLSRGDFDLPLRPR